MVRLGHSTAILSMVSCAIMKSLRFVPPMARPMGTPRPSVSTLRLTPLLPRSVEFLPTLYGPYPYHDGGAEVRKVFYKIQLQAIEPFNDLVKNVFEGRAKMPVKGLQRSQPLALRAVAPWNDLWWEHPKC